MAQALFSLGLFWQDEKLNQYYGFNDPQFKTSMSNSVALSPLENALIHQNKAVFKALWNHPALTHQDSFNRSSFLIIKSLSYPGASVLVEEFINFQEGPSDHLMNLLDHVFFTPEAAQRNYEIGRRIALTHPALDPNSSFVNPIFYGLGMERKREDLGAVMILQEMGHTQTFSQRGAFILRCFLTMEELTQESVEIWKDVVKKEIDKLNQVDAPNLLIQPLKDLNNLFDAFLIDREKMAQEIFFDEEIFALMEERNHFKKIRRQNPDAYPTKENYTYSVVPIPLGSIN